MGCRPIQRRRALRAERMGIHDQSNKMQQVSCDIYIDRSVLMFGSLNVSEHFRFLAKAATATENDCLEETNKWRALYDHSRGRSQLYHAQAVARVALHNNLVGSSSPRCHLSSSEQGDVMNSKLVFLHLQNVSLRHMLCPDLHGSIPTTPSKTSTRVTLTGFTSS